MTKKAGQGRGTMPKAKRSFIKMMETLEPFLPKPDRMPPEQPKDWQLPEIRVPEANGVHRSREPRA